MLKHERQSYYRPDRAGHIAILPGRMDIPGGLGSRHIPSDNYHQVVGRIFWILIIKAGFSC